MKSPLKTSLKAFASLILPVALVMMITACGNKGSLTLPRPAGTQGKPTANLGATATPTQASGPIGQASAQSK